MKDVATEDGELRVALDGHRAATGLCVIADEFWDVARVAADWDADGWTCARTRRLVRKAHFRARCEGRDGAAEAVVDL